MSDKHFDECVKAYEQARSIYAQLNDLEGQALALIALGDAHRAHFESVFRGTDSPFRRGTPLPPPPPPPPPRSISKFEALEELSKAENAYREAFEVYKGNNNLNGEALSLMRMGSIHLMHSLEQTDDSETVDSKGI